MSREHDIRPRKPPAQKPQTDDLDVSVDGLPGPEGVDIDLRAGRQKPELGRNPRGAPLSVNEAIARYKEAQARKFSEHITRPRDSAQKPVQHFDPTAVDRPTESSRQNTETPSESPRALSFSEAQADYRGKQSKTHVPVSAETFSRRVSSSRLRFGEQPEGLQTPSLSATAGAERRSDQIGFPQQTEADTAGKLHFAGDETMLPIDADPPADTKQPEDSTALDEEFSAADELTGDEIPGNSALSHERESFLSHEPHGRLQHNRVPTAPVKPPRRKPVTLDGVAFVPVDGKQTDPNVIRDTVASVNTNGQAPGGSAGTETGTTPDVPADTTADASAADTPAPGSDADSQSGGEAVDDGASEPDTDNPTPDDHAHGGSGGKKKNSKLNFDDETAAPETEKSVKKLEKAKRKAERSSGKLQTAKENTPKKRTFRMNKEFDAETGKMTKRLRFEKEVKTQREHLKGPLITRPVKAGAGAVVGYAHSKMYQVEEDNVGVKAAHRGESLAESGLRTAYRRHKTAPYRKVQKLERKTANLNAKASYQQALQDNPELKKKHLSRMIQKRRINREYAKMARESKRAGEAVKKTAVTTEKIAAKAVSAVKNHPVVFGVIALLLLMVIIMFGMISSCSNMASGIGAAVGVMSYTADDTSVDSAELYYTELETDLRLAALNAETDHGGFDEYRYSIDAVGHDPFMLMAYLTAVYQNFDLADIRAVLNDVFNEQYQLTFTPSMEIRYRTETHTSSYTDPETGETTESDYDVEVPYEWHILTVTLTSQPLSGVINPRMNGDQNLQYDILMQSKGLRQYVSSPFAIDWLPYVSSYYGYRVHPISGVKDYHMGIDIALPTGTEILAAHAGTVTFAGVLGGYGNVVVIEDGGGLETKYAHCDTLLVSTGQIVSEGYVVATVGNTGSSTGPHLHFEVIRDGQYLNPIYFAQSGG